MTFSKAKRQIGVTLLELMITISILAIVLTVVAPNIGTFLIKNRVTSEINGVSGVIQYARHISIDQQTVVTLCPSDDYETCTTDWNDPKIVFIDENGDGDRTPGGANPEELLVSTDPVSDATKMTGPGNSITFTENGAASETFSLLVCPQSNEAEYARAINVSLQGRVRISKDSDDDGIHEDTDGDALTCS
jgi:type IV fimbrial biogenesis protein FimT